MTLKEADEASVRCLKITYQGVTYARITQIGYKYDAIGTKIPYVRLQDKCGYSFTDASPQLCEIAVENNSEKNTERDGA